MRIISKFQDYYDAGLAYGIDNNLVFVRKTEEVEVKPFRGYYRSASTTYGKFTVNVTPIIIGFCGTMYPALKVVTLKRNKLAGYTEISNIITYDASELEELLGTSFKPYQVKVLLEHFTKDYSEYLKYFEQYHTPYFLLKGGSNLILLPNLKDLRFSKVLDAYTAFQELSMYVGGLKAEAENHDCEIADKDLVIGKGFNKQSFRKRKQ